MPCLTPRRLVIEGREYEFACQKCKECRKGRVRDLVGRALAESKYAVGSSYITLTYGVDRRIDGAADVKGANVLTYSHVRTWLKRLRDAGYPMRYIIAGEYGSMKGRAHWHCILWWTREVPPIPEHVADRKGVSRCWNDPWWEPIGGGHTQWAEVTRETITYCCSYSLKRLGDPDAQGMVRQSTRPLIGAKYFDHWAKMHVDQGLAISDRYYTIAGSKDPKTGKLWRYYMTDAALAYVVKSFKRQWEERNPGRHMPPHPFLERELDRLAVPMPDPDKPLAARRFQARPFIPTPNGEPVFFDQVRNAYYFFVGYQEKRPEYGGELKDRWVFYRQHGLRWWSFDHTGERCWSDEFVSVPEGERRWRAYALARSADEYREAAGRVRRGGGAR